MSPTAQSALCDSSMTHTVPPTITSPSPTGAAYDGASLIRPRM